MNGEGAQHLFAKQTIAEQLQQPGGVCFVIADRRGTHPVLVAQAETVKTEQGCRVGSLKMNVDILAEHGEQVLVVEVVDTSALSPAKVRRLSQSRGVTWLEVEALPFYGNYWRVRRWCAGGILRESGERVDVSARPLAWPAAA